MKVSIRTVVIGSCFGGGDSLTRIDLPRAKTTARVLIEQKVQKDVAAFNRNHYLIYGREYRTPEEMIEDEKAAADPKRHGTYEAVVWEPEADRAAEAWREGTFRITVDDRKIDSLDEEVLLQPGSDVVFLRLMPFVGG